MSTAANDWSRQYDTVVDGIPVTGTVTKGVWEILDYGVVALVENKTYSFDLRMVWTPPRYRVGWLKHGPKMKSIQFPASMEVSKAFEYALQEVVKWHRELYPTNN